MNRAQAYIFKLVAISTIFIVGTLTAVVWLTQSMRFVKYILNKGLAIETFLHLTVLLLPSFLLITLPVALFLGTLFTMNKMTNDRELVVLRSVGISPMGLARPVLFVGALVMGVGYFISLYLMPASFQEFRNLQSEIRNNFSAGLIQEGAFTTIGNGITIYVRSRDGDELRGILVQDNRDATKSVTMMAERGVIVPSDKGPQVVMAAGNRQEMEIKTGKVSVLYFSRYSVAIRSFSKEKEYHWRQPNERFLKDLLWPGQSEHDQFYKHKLIAEGHNRLVVPLYALAMPLIALVIMLTGQFNKRGQMTRLIVAVAIVSAIQGLAIALYSAAAKVPFLIPVMYANAILPIIVSVYILSSGPKRPKAIALAPPPAATPAE